MISKLNLDLFRIWFRPLDKIKQIRLNSYPNHKHYSECLCTSCSPAIMFPQEKKKESGSESVYSSFMVDTSALDMRRSASLDGVQVRWLLI